jgi:hypothetical protein
MGQFNHILFDKYSSCVIIEISTLLAKIQHLVRYLYYYISNHIMFPLNLFQIYKRVYALKALTKRLSRHVNIPLFDNTLLENKYLAKNQ